MHQNNMSISLIINYIENSKRGLVSFRGLNFVWNDKSLNGEGKWAICELVFAK